MAVRDSCLTRHTHTHNSTHSARTQYVGVHCALKGGLLKSIIFIQEGTTSSHYWRRRVWHSAAKRRVLDVLRLVTLLCLTCSPLFHCCSWCFFLFFIFFTQRSDLACSERLVSPSGDVGLNSRVWSDYVSAVWEIPLGPVGSLHILCWQ